MMKLFAQRILAVLFAAACVGCAQDDVDEPTSGSEDIGRNPKIIYSSRGASAGELLVKFHPDAIGRLEQGVTRSGATRSGVEAFDAVLGEMGGVTIERLFTIDPKTEDRARAAGLHLWYKVRFGNQESLEQVATRFASVAEVSYVQYNIHVRRIENRRPVPFDQVWGGDVQQATRADELPFDDPKLNKQWHYINTGDQTLTSPIRAGADVDCKEAWKLCTGDPSIIVAVVDEGVMYNHEDLSDNMWVNEAELDGQTGVDDDGNGYRDDIYGYNFVLNTGKITWTNPDDVGHGTHVAGTIAAVNNNGRGVCGIAGGSGLNDGVKIMSLQIFDGEDGASADATANAIKYAADNGALILQCSWGYDAGIFTSDSQWARACSAEKDAIDYFIANAGKDNPASPMTGGLAIFAAGNESARMPGYPASYGGVVCVTAFAPDFTPSTFTNYGQAADIAAPGGDSDYTLDDAGTILSTQTDAFGLYGYMEGTSMACPHVSGVAALGLSYAVKLGKHFTSDEFRSLLLTSVNDIDSYLEGDKDYYYFYKYYGEAYPKTIHLPNYVGKMGGGYTDAYKLLLSIEGTAAIWIKQNEATEIDLSKYFGSSENLTFAVSVSKEDERALGLSSLVKGNKLIVVCANTGSASLTLRTNIGGTIVSKQLVVVARPQIATNGGWL